MPALAPVPAKGVSFYTPAQEPLVGAALVDNPPTLFKPLTIRGVTFQNRIWVAPMCMYSAQDGKMNPFHIVHLGGFAFRGASLTIIEATGVLPNGRITPQCTGLWSDDQIEPLRSVVEFCHSQGQKIGIQLAHSGRKGSTIPTQLNKVRGASTIAPKEIGGWPEDVMGPSPICWGQGHCQPREMTKADIQNTINAFVDAAHRAVKAGIDVIEIHSAHGYLLCSFLSPLSNQRTDEYGGSFENRTRLLIEVIKAVRGVIPQDMPLLVRVSATEWMEKYPEPSWTVEETIELAKLLPALGVDLLDISSGGNHEKQSLPIFNDKQPDISGRVRKALRDVGITNLLIGAVGGITEAEKAKAIVEKKTDPANDTIEVVNDRGEIATADVVMAARQFLREPEWVLRVAHNLEVPVQWPYQYTRVQFPRGSKI